MGNITIEVQARKNYGNWVYYPINKNAEIMAELLGTKTIGYTKLPVIKALGIGIIIKGETPSTNF